jgi:hypothetical protein
VTTFAGKKLDVLKAAPFDVSDTAFKILAVILGHVNEKTLRTKLSDATIALEARTTTRTVRRARKALHPKWLKWVRTNDANIYSVNFEAARPILAEIKAAREARRRKINEIGSKSRQIGHQRPLQKQVGDRTPVSARIGHQCPPYTYDSAFKEEAYGKRLSEEDRANEPATGDEREDPQLASDILTVDILVDVFRLAAARRWGALESKYRYPFVRSLRELDDPHMQGVFRHLLERSGVDEAGIERELRTAFGGARLN